MLQTDAEKSVIGKGNKCTKQTNNKKQKEILALTRNVYCIYKLSDKNDRDKSVCRRKGRAHYLCKFERAWGGCGARVDRSLSLSFLSLSLSFYRSFLFDLSKIDLSSIDENFCFLFQLPTKN